MEKELKELREKIYYVDQEDKEKVNVLKNFLETFSYSNTKNFLDFEFAMKNFKIDTILSDEFSEEIIKKHVKKSSSADFIAWGIQWNSSSVFAELSDVKRREIFYKISSTFNPSQNANFDAVFKVTIGKEKKYVKEFILSEYTDSIPVLDRDRILREILTNYEITEEEIGTIFKKYPDFKEYPIIINNPNVTDEVKIALIKLTFKMKDISKFAATIGANMTDLSSIGLFIEAAIMQNNRIIDKMGNIKNVYARMFIGMRGDYFSANKIYNIISTDESDFFKKYPIDAKTFSELFIERINASSYWSNARKVLFTIYDKLFENPDIDEIIELSKGLELYQEKLAEKIKEDSYKILRETDDERFSQLLDIIMRNEKYKFSSVPKGLADVINERFNPERNDLLTYLDDNRSWRYSYANNNNRPLYDNMEIKKEALSNFSPEILKELRFITKDIWKMLFVITPECSIDQSSTGYINKIDDIRYRGSQFPTNSTETYRIIFTSPDDIIEIDIKNPGFKDRFIRDYYEKLNDPENIEEILPDLISYFTRMKREKTSYFSTSQYGDSFSKDFTQGRVDFSDPESLLGRITNSISDTAAELFPEFTNIPDNMLSIFSSILLALNF